MGITRGAPNRHLTYRPYMALNGRTAHLRHYRTEYRSMNTSDLLDALRAAQTLDAIDALDALIDDQASSGAVRHALHTAARIERERLERALVPTGG